MEPRPSRPFMPVCERRGTSQSTEVASEWYICNLCNEMLERQHAIDIIQSEGENRRIMKNLKILINKGHKLSLQNKFQFEILFLYTSNLVPKILGLGKAIVEECLCISIGRKLNPMFTDLER